MSAEHVLLMEMRKMGGKWLRFDRVMADNAGCLPCGTKVMNRAARNAAVDAARADFGTTYIVLLNPAYGSWVSAPPRTT